MEFIGVIPTHLLRTSKFRVAKDQSAHVIKTPKAELKDPQVKILVMVSSFYPQIGELAFKVGRPMTLLFLRSGVTSSRAVPGFGFVPNSHGRWSMGHRFALRSMAFVQLFLCAVDPPAKSSTFRWFKKIKKKRPKKTNKSMRGLPLSSSLKIQPPTAESRGGHSACAPLRFDPRGRARPLLAAAPGC